MLGWIICRRTSKARRWPASYRQSSNSTLPSWRQSIHQWLRPRLTDGLLTATAPYKPDPKPKSLRGLIVNRKGPFRNRQRPLRLAAETALHAPHRTLVRWGADRPPTVCLGSPTTSGAWWPLQQSFDLLHGEGRHLQQLTQRASAPRSPQRLAFRHRLPPRIEVRPDLGVAVVYIGAKLHRAVAIYIRGLVDHEYRHGRRQIASVGAARRDRLIDRVDRLLHHQGGQFARILYSYASMADAAVIAAEQIF